MAEAFLAACGSNVVGALVVDYLVKPIDRRIRYLFRFRNIVDKLHTRQRELSTKQEEVNEKVKEAKLHIRTQVTPKSVNDWLTEAENALKDVECLDSRIEENKKCCCIWGPNWCWRYQLSKEVEKKTLKLLYLVENSQFELVGHHAELPGLEFLQSKDIVASKSSNAAFKKITEALRAEEVKMMGVWGMGGVGKTTLVTQVGTQLKESRLFNKVINVVVSQTQSIENIQNKISDFLNLKLEKTTREGKAEELWLRLEKEEKVLIILDDMWKELNLKEVGIPLAEKGKGCKIILTTRSKRACESMGCQVIVPVDVLGGDEAWDLFKMKANLDERRVSKDIIKEAKKVAEECKGLPVAIVTLASALKGTKTPKAWELARKQLERSRLPEIGNIEEEGEKNAYRCIEMSYQYLKKEATKRCFLLCSLYPEDHSINVEDLVQYAWGLEFYAKVDSVEECRIQVLRAIDFLKDSCLLLEGRRKYRDNGRYVKLHDIVRDVALWIASKAENDFMMKTRLELLNENSESCKAVSLLNNEEIEFPNRIVLPKLEILLLENCNVQGICLREMRELRVLRVSVPDDSKKIFSLYALTSLQNLRALQLENFEDFKFLGNLKTLEILNLCGSGIEGLANELERLENIKILDLTRCTFSSRFPSNIIRKLSKLEELYLKDSNIEEVTDDILSEINLLSRLTVLSLKLSSFHFREDLKLPGGLERYEISISTVNKSCSIHITEKSWKIKGVIPLNVFSLLPENLESLEVSDDLKLTNLSCIGELPTQHVRLEGLVDLRIKNCPRLKSLFLLSLAQSLVLLETLKISNCHGLKEIVTECKGEEEIISSSIDSDHDDSLCFPKLRKLEIKNCNVLQSIFPTSMAPQGLLGLSLTIWNCPQLKQVMRVAKDGVENDIVLQQQLQSLRSLQEFSMSYCRLFTDSVVQLEAEEANLRMVRLSAFKESFRTSKELQLYRAIEDHNLVPEGNKDGLNGLTSLDLRECMDVECLVDTTTRNGPTSSSAFSNLERLNIIDMKGLERLCKGQPPQGFLNNLKQLNIYDCEKVQVLFQMDEKMSLKGNQDQPLSNLQFLELHHLTELRWILKGSFSLQSLRFVYIYDCRKLESVFPPSLIPSLVLLEQLDIRKCGELKTLFTEPEINDGEIIESKSCSSFPLCLPKLKTLVISKCSKVEYVVPITLAQGLPALASIEIVGCYDLKQVFMGKEEDGVDHHDTCNVFLPCLQHLHLHWLPKLTNFVLENCVVKAPALKSLKVEECPEFRNFPIQQQVNNKQLEFKGNELSIFKGLSSLTKHLFLKGVWDHKNLVPDVVDSEQLDGLTSLRINKWDDCKYLIDTSEAGMISNEAPPIILLSNLQHLELIDLWKLKWIVRGPAHVLNFQCLKLLKISMCQKLEYLFSASMAQTLRSLEELKIALCNALKSVFMEYLESDDGIQQESNTLCTFPKLKTLEIKECPSLEYAFPPASAPSLPSLQMVKLYRVRRLKSIIEGNSFIEAPALEDLYIKYCPEFMYSTLHKQVNNPSPSKELTFSMSDRDGVNVESYNMANTQLRQTSPNFECLTFGKFEQLFQLQDGYVISSLEYMWLANMIWLREIWKGPIHVATNLKELRVDNCNNLTYIFPVMLIPHLPQLSILWIRWCDNLKKIIANDNMLASSSSQVPQLEKEMVFPQLKKIVLVDLSRLESLSPVGYHLEFPYLELLDVSKCSKMITSFTIDYLTLTVHAKTNQAISQVDDASPSQEDIFWKRCRPTKGLRQYVEDAKEISPLKWKMLHKTCQLTG